MIHAKDFLLKKKKNFYVLLAMSLWNLLIISEQKWFHSKSVRMHTIEGLKKLEAHIYFIFYLFMFLDFYRYWSQT